MTTTIVNNNCEFDARGVIREARQICLSVDPAVMRVPRPPREAREGYEDASADIALGTHGKE